MLCRRFSARHRGVEKIYIAIMSQLGESQFGETTCSIPNKNETWKGLSKVWNTASEGT